MMVWVSNLSHTSVWYFGNQSSLQFDLNGTTNPLTTLITTTKDECTLASGNNENFLCLLRV